MNAASSPSQLILTSADAAAMDMHDAEVAESVAIVNGKAIPHSRLDHVMKSSGPIGQSDPEETMSRALDMVIGQEVLYQEAAKMGFETDPEVALQIEINKEEIVIDAYLRDYAKRHPIGEDRLKQEYETQKSLSGGKEYKARHILVDTEDEATMIVAELKKGVSFEELAIQYSVDGGSKYRGGSLDWAPAVQYVPEFCAALKKLSKGQTTEAPVKTESGWHIISVEDERELAFPAFEDVKLKIYEVLQRRAVDKIIAELRAKAEIR